MWALGSDSLGLGFWALALRVSAQGVGFLASQVFHFKLPHD